MTGTGDGFARRLRVAMDESTLSAREVARRCTAAGAPVSAPTLRSWAQGGSLPSRQASFKVVDALEQVLGTAPGRLSTALHAAEQLGSPEGSAHAQLLAEVQGFGARCGIPAAGLLRRDLISTTLDLDERESALVRHRVLATAVAPGVDGLLSVVHGVDAEAGQLEVLGGEVAAIEPLGRDFHALAIRLPRELGIEEPALVDVVAPTHHDLEVPGRIATLSPWPATLIVAALRAEDRVYHGRAVRTDVDAPQERVRAEDVDLLPGATGMQCVARDVQAAEVAVEWHPMTPTH